MATDEIFDAGYFTSTGSAVQIPLRSSYSYFEVLNYTQMATTQNPGRVVRSSWQLGFAPGYALTGTKTNSTSAMNETIATSGGFTLVNTSVNTLGPLVTSTGISNASPPVVSVASTAGIIAGDVYRVTNSTGALNLSGMDFTIDSVVTDTSFTLAYMVAAGAATAASLYRVPYNPIYYPTKRLITKVTTGTTTTIVFSVTHGYVAGMKLQFLVPVEYGMTQLNGLVGKILSVNTATNAVTVDIDSSAFTAFSFPTALAYPFNFAQASPVGEIPTIVSGATQNDAVLAMQLGSAVCGSANDVMYWRGWKAFRYSTSLPTS